MRAAGSYQFTLIIVITGVIGTIGGDVSPVVGDTQNVKQLTANRTDRLSADRGSPKVPGAVAEVGAQPQVAAFAQSSGAQMSEHHRAHPDAQPVEIPFFEHPPPLEVPVGAGGLIQQRPPALVRVDAVAAPPVPGPDVEPFAPPLPDRSTSDLCNPASSSGKTLPL